MKTTNITVRLIVLLFIVLLSSQHLSSQGCVTNNSGGYWGRVNSYNPCTSLLTVEILTHRKYTGSDGGNNKYYSTQPKTTVNGYNVNTFELVNNTGGRSEYYRTYRIYTYKIPSNVFNNSGSATVRHSWTWDLNSGDGVGNGCGASATLSTIYTPQFESDPFNLTLSQESDCNKVLLNWNNDVDIFGCTNDMNVTIERKISNSSEYEVIDTIPYPASNYEDVIKPGGIEKDEEYDYRIRYLFQPFPLFSQYSGYVSAQRGYTKKSPDQPFNINATDDNCEDAVTLTWEWDGIFNDLQGFRIERRENLPTSEWDSLTIVGRDVRMYVDAPEQYNVEYLYRIFTLNNCDPQDISQPSSEVIGIKPGPPPEPMNVTSVSDNNSITIRWEINTDPDRFINLSQFIIERTVIGALTAPLEIPVSKDLRSYIDTDVFNCVTYIYTVKSQGTCYGDNEGVPYGSDTTANLVELDLTQAFATDGSAFKGSTGYFSDKVQLTWVNNNAGQTNQVRIYRKVLGSTEPFALLNSVPDDSGIYNDFSAEAGVIYEYEIIADGPCENSTVSTNRIGTVGFRSKSGQVSGNVSFTGGIAVKDVKIQATRDDIVVGKSILLNGGKMSIPHHDNQDLTEDLLAEAWIKPANLGGNAMIIKKQDSYELGYDATRQVLLANVYLESDPSTAIEVTTHIDSIEVAQWCHLAVQVRDDSIHLIRDGVILNSTAFTSSAIHNSDNSIVLGEGFLGNMKEVRIWNTKRTNEEVLRQHSAYASGSIPGMITYLPLDEGAGSYAYDRSQISVSLFNRNHAEIDTVNVTAYWSDEIPTASQLSYNAYTDEKGNYRMKLPYVNAGETYELVPIYKTHQFAPSSRILFVGDAASVINEVDFEDISSFKVNGTVFFDGMTCSSEGVSLKIDGQIVVQHGNPVRTGSDGYFEIQVPIGDHVITIEKAGHEFSAGRFPSTGAFDFQEPKLNLKFKDATKRKVIGRVVGGLREGNKKPGLGLSKNNIGQSLLTFDPTRTCGWIIDSVNVVTRDDTTIYTDLLTGEYQIELPPLNYVVDDVDVLNNDEGVDFGALRTIDLRNMNSIQTVSDTVTVEGGESVLYNTYHLQHDYIYRSSPELDVQNQGANGPLEGDPFYIYSSPSSEKDTIDLISTPLEFPVFTQGSPYSAIISAFESYKNNDPGVPEHAQVDRVPISEGTITIQNQLAENPGKVFELEEDEDQDGFISYTFTGGSPNLTTNSSIPYYSYTKEFTVSLVSGSKSNSWMPADTLPPGGNRAFRGYLIGTANVDQSDFVTQGPEVVDYVLRDPPGSQSSATRTKQTTTVSEETWDWGGGGNTELNVEVKLGTKFNLGFGYETPTKIENSLGLNLTTQFTGEYGKSVIKTITNTEDWSTSSDPLFTGADADLYIGRSNNYLFGAVTSLQLVPEDLCDISSITCLGDNGSGFQMAKQKSIGIAEGDIKTQFIYTQKHIEENVMPQLEELRNYMLENDSRYTSKLSLDHPCYGMKNDDPLFSKNTCPNTVEPTSDPDNETMEDRDGPSYRFAESSIFAIDSVRVLNNQINLWIQAIRENEAYKIDKAVPAVIDTIIKPIKIQGATIGFDTTITQPTHYNVSFVGGGASYTRSITNSRAVERRKRFEFNISQSATLKIGTEVGGAGFERFAKIGLTQTRRQLNSFSTDRSHTVSYTLKDDGEHDDFTVDVFEGSGSGGPVFKTLGGNSSCPHEDTERSKYFRRGQILSPGTKQHELPEINITPSVLYNVPQSSRGVFRMELSNKNEDFPWEYGTQLIKNSNPQSANVNVGFVDEITSTYVIPTAETISRDLFVEIGNGYDFDSLLIVIHSVCQYRQGTSRQKDIADSAYISIHFIPECTPISLAKPTDQWVLNNTHNNKLDIIAKDYDINHLNFNSLQLEYKEANSAEWIALQKYYKDTTGVIDNDLRQVATSSAQTLYEWDVSSIPDGPYDLRATTDCEVVSNESPIYSGYMDRINPHPFGTPSPGDGVLDPNDDIIIKFNEPVAIGSVNLFNFDVRGVLNGSKIRHETSLAFDGVNDYAEIPAYQLQKRSLTIEAWVKRNGTTGGTIVSQGAQSNDQLILAMDDSGRITFTLGEATIVSDYAIPADKWHHVAATYDRESSDAAIYIAPDDDLQIKVDNNFITDYTGSGKIYVGRDISGNKHSINGSVHGLRIWSKAQELTDISIKRSILLSGREGGLIGSWGLDEGDGALAKDNVKGRHATIVGATWSILPQNHAYAFDGVDDYLSTNAATLGFDEETDLTFEVWFKTSAAKEQTLFANGRADGSVPLPEAWDISLNSAGAVIVQNDGSTIATPDGWNDGDWHHFAAVVERTRAISLYIDGNLVTTANSAGLNKYVGQTLSIGARVWRSGNSDMNDRFFEGNIDEVRIWNTARQSDQIKRDRLYQFRGEEPGLVAYFPFDGIAVDVGSIDRVPVLTDESVNEHNLTPYGQSTLNFKIDAPPIQLPRLIEELIPTYSINNDEIYIELNEPAARLENTVIDITVRGIKDLAGNVMQSPKTWTAFIDKNQVFWEHEYFQHEMMSGETYEISTKIVNTGGGQERYTISNLPTWMTASPSSGIIEPNSTIPVKLTIAPYVNIGAYEQDVFVSTESFGFNERLLIDLKVSAEPPVWEVASGDYNASMNYIGEIYIDGRISTDPEDIIIAMIDDTIRGVGHVKYSPGTGKHLVFLDIFGYETGDPNDSNGKNLVFQLWDASEDKIYPKVTPLDHVFSEGVLRGSLSNPIPFKSSDEEEITYNLKRGWNWISFPVVGTELDSLDELFEEVEFHLADRLTNHRETVFKDGNGAWKGSSGLRNYGVNIRDGYRLYLAQADTFTYTGTYKHPRDYKIPLAQGWTSVGMISEDPVDVTTAMSSLNPQDGDWIKGQVGFAVYEDGFGWNGSIDRLTPQKSYMVKMAARDTLIYPNIRGLKSKQSNLFKSQERLYSNYQLQPEMFDYSMSMVVTIEGFSNWKDSDGWHIAAYTNNKCRGINEITMDDRRNNRLGYLQVYGSEEEQLSFRLISADGTETIYLNEKYLLQSDGTLGLPSTPEVLTIGAPCLTNIDGISDYQSFMNDNKQIQASHVVKLDNRISMEGSLRVNAGEAIELKTGFESITGSAIELFIQPCEQ